MSKRQHNFSLYLSPGFWHPPCQLPPGSTHIISLPIPDTFLHSYIYQLFMSKYQTHFYIFTFINYLYPNYRHISTFNINQLFLPQTRHISTFLHFPIISVSIPGKFLPFYTSLNSTFQDFLFINCFSPEADTCLHFCNCFCLNSIQKYTLHNVFSLQFFLSKLSLPPGILTARG